MTPPLSLFAYLQNGKQVFVFKTCLPCKTKKGNLHLIKFLPRNHFFLKRRVKLKTYNKNGLKELFDNFSLYPFIGGGQNMFKMGKMLIVFLD
jgi:hypothetical protein